MFQGAVKVGIFALFFPIFWISLYIWKICKVLTFRKVFCWTFDGWLQWLCTNTSGLSKHAIYIFLTTTLREFFPNSTHFYLWTNAVTNQSLGFACFRQLRIWAPTSFNINIVLRQWGRSMNIFDLSSGHQLSEQQRDGLITPTFTFPIFINQRYPCTVAILWKIFLLYMKQFYKFDYFVSPG